MMPKVVNITDRIDCFFFLLVCGCGVGGGMGDVRRFLG